MNGLCQTGSVTITYTGTAQCLLIYKTKPGTGQTLLIGLLACHFARKDPFKSLNVRKCYCSGDHSLKA